jgi:hypothetical protein
MQSAEARMKLDYKERLAKKQENSLPEKSSSRGGK